MNDPMDIKALTHLAEQGDAKAQYKLGEYYEYTDYVKAEYWYKKAIKQNYIEAYPALADLHDLNDRTEEAEEVIALLKVTAEHGNAEAQYQLGKCYEFSKYIENDDDKAEYWYKKAIEQNYIEAYIALSDLYYFDDRTEEAIALLKVAVEQDNAEAKIALAELYDCEDRTEEAIALLKVVAEQGNAEAQYELGQHYEDTDCAKAKYWYKKAIEQNYIEAYVALAELYDSDDRTAEAIALLKVAVEQGSDEAIDLLVEYHDCGNYIEPDLERVFYLYKTYVKNNDDSYYSFKLGQMYEKGLGTDKNMDKALACYETAADKGSVYGKYGLALCYLEGKGVSKDSTKALSMINAISDVNQKNLKLKIAGYKAILKDNNDASARQMLIRYYEKGIYNEDDITNIYDLYQHDGKKLLCTLLRQSRPFSPKKGNPTRQFELAQCYRFGWGTKPNEKKAVYWLKRAADNGNAAAKKMQTLTYSTAFSSDEHSSSLFLFMTSIIDLFISLYLID